MANTKKRVMNTRRKEKRAASWARAQRKKEKNIAENKARAEANLQFCKDNNIEQIYTFRTTGEFAGSTRPVSPGKRIRMWRRAQQEKN